MTSAKLLAFQIASICAGIFAVLTSDNLFIRLLCVLGVAGIAALIGTGYGHGDTTVESAPIESPKSTAFFDPNRGV